MSLPQPVPPSWKDLGKSSNDLLGKDFPIGSTQLEVKTTTPSGVAFKVNGTSIPSTGVNAVAETKYTDRKHGLTLTQSWTTANALTTNVELENNLVSGLKLDANATITPGYSAGEKVQPSSKNVLLNAAYKTPGLHTRANLNLFKGPTFTADAILGRDGFLLGAEAQYNVSTGQIAGYAAGLGFSAPEYAVALLATNKLSQFTASYYHRVSRDVEAGGRAIYNSKKPADGVSLEVGTKTYLDQAAFIKAKINNTGVLSLGYTQALRPGVKASFGLALDTTKLNGNDAAAHKVGASFTFES
ncbi:voltage-dependent ion-selective channel [Fomitiporia mediterranea MF3/22]|uniref:voltage-dependent ion-selective channel n=1 Tax=Fomitiporia mediterranea (strain MF3/22) TaxID=694068 RepID=UPI0004407AF8|nr:voltage-dependent ion-selective channel [Fomitiporia mediterranea MF3/22]EJC97826.1 voltage-dependent ion-selective channel [Fomitiporia mediterranea MF3/22]